MHVEYNVKIVFLSTLILRNQ